MTALELFVKRGYYETKITDIAAARFLCLFLFFVGNRFRQRFHYLRPQDFTGVF